MSGNKTFMYDLPFALYGNSFAHLCRWEIAPLERNWGTFTHTRCIVYTHSFHNSCSRNYIPLDPMTESNLVPRPRPLESCMAGPGNEASRKYKIDAKLCRFSLHWLYFYSYTCEPSWLYRHLTGLVASCRDAL